MVGGGGGGGDHLVLAVNLEAFCCRYGISLTKPVGSLMLGAQRAKLIFLRFKL